MRVLELPEESAPGEAMKKALQGPKEVDMPADDMAVEDLV